VKEVLGSLIVTDDGLQRTALNKSAGRAASFRDGHQVAGNHLRHFDPSISGTGSAGAQAG
jgi:hypothetical protein